MDQEKDTRLSVEVPLIDTTAPDDFKTATFGLG